MPDQKPEIDLLTEVKATIHMMLEALNEFAPDEGYEDLFTYGAAIKRAKSLLKLLKAHEGDFALFDPKVDTAEFRAPRSFEIAEQLTNQTPTTK